MCTNLSLTVSWYKYVQYQSLFHRKLVHICTNLYLAGTNMYKSFSHSELVQVGTEQISLSPEVGTNVYKSLSHRTPVKICTNLSLSEIEIVVCACPAPLPPPPDQRSAASEVGIVHD